MVSNTLIKRIATISSGQTITALHLHHMKNPGPVRPSFMIYHKQNFECPEAELLACLINGLH